MSRRRWDEWIRDLLVKIVLYQHGRYDPELLDAELTEFLRAAEEPLCNAYRRNGGICFRGYVYDYGERDAEQLLDSDIRNWIHMYRVTRSRGFLLLAQLARISRQLYYLDRLPLSDKIMLFDSVVHAEHYAGSFTDVPAHMRNVLGVDIERVKREAERILREKYGIGV